MGEEPIDVLIDPRSASFERILGVFLYINDLFVEKVGSGLQFDSRDLIEEEVPESPFELGTPSTEKVMKEAIFPEYVARQQVYDAIDKYAVPQMAAQIKKNIDNRFPEDKFDDTFPYCAVFNILYNDYFCDNKKKVTSKII